MQKMLKVKVVGDAMVTDFEALEDGVMRFLSRRHEPHVAKPIPKGQRFSRNQTLLQGDGGTWPLTDEVVEVPFRKEYLDEIKAGTLAPADEATARLCGVPFSA